MNNLRIGHRFLSFALFLLIASNAFGQWVQTNGPYVKYVKAFTLNGATAIAGIGANPLPAMVFAGTDGGGIYRSTNSGTSWAAANNGLTNSNIHAISVSGTNLFAGTDNGVYLSRDSGTNWTQAGITTSSVYSIVMIGTNASPTMLFAGTHGGVFQSTDTGASWTLDTTGMPNPDVTALFVTGSNSPSPMLFAATYGQFGNDTVYLLTNNGASWTAANTGLPARSYVFDFAAIGKFLFAGTAGAGVFRSTDNGTSWIDVNNGLTSTSIYSLAASGSNLFAATYNGVFLSTDNGSTWGLEDMGLPATPYVLALAVIGTNIFAGCYTNGVYLSTDNGANWSPIDSGSSGAVVSDFTSIEKKGSPTMLFAGSDVGAFVSTDIGANWTAVDAGLRNTDVTALATIGTNLFAGTSDTIYRSSDNGNSWSAANGGMPIRSNDAAFAVNGTNLFVGTHNGIFLSTDSGRSWNAASNGLYLFSSVDAFLVSGTNTSTANIFAGTVPFNGYPGKGVFLSTDNGASWGSTSYPAVPDVTALAVIGTNLFAGTDTTGVYVSPDSGVTWNSLNNGFPSSGNVGSWASVSALAVVDTNLFAGTSMGVYLSTNEGVTWTDESQGLLDSNIRTLELVDTNLFVGTATGVWRRPLSQMIAAKPPPASVAQSQNVEPEIQSYPNPLTKSVIIAFSCAESCTGEVTIVNLLGVEVARLFSGELNAGEHLFSWDASQAAAGVYECIVRANGNVQVVPLVVLR